MADWVTRLHKRTQRELSQKKHDQESLARELARAGNFKDAAKMAQKAAVTASYLDR